MKVSQHVVNCEQMKLNKILGLNVKMKNDESKFSPIMTVNVILLFASILCKQANSTKLSLKIAS